MDELFVNVGNKPFFCEKLNKRMEKTYVGLFWKIGHMKCWSHVFQIILYISLIWSILSSSTFNTYKVLNEIQLNGI
jgi:hypothetical protein